MSVILLTGGQALQLARDVIGGTSISDPLAVVVVGVVDSSSRTFPWNEVGVVAVPAVLDGVANDVAELAARAILATPTDVGVSTATAIVVVVAVTALPLVVVVVGVAASAAGVAVVVVVVATASVTAKASMAATSCSVCEECEDPPPPRRCWRFSKVRSWA